MTNSEVIFRSEQPYLSYQSLLSIKAYCCCLCWTKVLTGACFLYLIVPTTLPGCGKFIISRTSDFCQTGSDHRAKIITRESGCTNRAITFTLFPATIKHPQHLISSPFPPPSLPSVALSGFPFLVYSLSNTTLLRLTQIPFVLQGKGTTKT